MGCLSGKVRQSNRIKSKLVDMLVLFRSFTTPHFPPLCYYMWFLRRGGMMQFRDSSRTQNWIQQTVAGSASCARLYPDSGSSPRRTDKRHARKSRLQRLIERALLGLLFSFSLRSYGASLRCRTIRAWQSTVLAAAGRSHSNLNQSCFRNGPAN